MKGTKQRILRAAKLLYNQHGVANISQRAISNHIAISPGNLTYHFNKREEIVAALYEELAGELRDIIKNVEIETSNFQTLYEVTKSINKLLFENRFFIIDFAQVTRTNDEIKKDYAQLTQEREELLLALLNNFLKQGWLRNEELPHEFVFMAKRLQLLNDYWLLSVGNTNEEFMLKHTRIYTENYMQSIYPYATVEGEKVIKIILEY